MLIDNSTKEMERHLRFHFLTTASGVDIEIFFQPKSSCLNDTTAIPIVNGDSWAG